MAHPVDPKKLHDAAQQIENANKASAETRALEAAASDAAAKARDSRIREDAEHRIADNALRDAGAQPVRPTDGFDLGEGPVPADRPQQPAVVEREPIYRTHPGAFTIGIIALVLAAVALVLALVQVASGNKDEVARATSESSAKIINEHGRAIGKLEGETGEMKKQIADTGATAKQALVTATEAKAAASAASTCNACCKVCVKKEHHKRKHAVAPPPAPKAEQAPQKCAGCIPTPQAQVLRTEPSKVCAIAIQRSSTDRTLLGKMILGADVNHPDKIGIIFNSFMEGVPDKVAGTPYSLGSKVKDDKFDCDVAKHQIEAHWPVVTAYFKVPNDCLPKL